MNTKRLTAAQKEERRLSRAERKRMIADKLDRDAKAEAEVDVAAELARVDELTKEAPCRSHDSIARAERRFNYTWLRGRLQAGTNSVPGTRLN